MNVAMLARPLTHLGVKLLFAVKQHAPELLVSSGIIGFGLSIYGAVKGTIKAVDILDERDEQIKAVEECESNEKIEYTTEQSEKDRKNIKIKTTWNLVKAYAPAVSMFVLSIILVLAGFRILHMRNVGLAAAYKALEKTYEKREQFIRDKYGPDAFDEEPIEAVSAQEIKKVKSERRQKFIDRTKYCVLFDEFFDRWRPDAGINKFIIQSAENYVTNKLIKDEPVLLIDVTRILGMPDDRAVKELHANIVGWNPRDPECDMKGDFGLMDPINNDFCSGFEYVAVLTFNVDGPVYDDVARMKSKRRLCA